MRCGEGDSSQVVDIDPPPAPRSVQVSGGDGFLPYFQVDSEAGDTMADLTDETNAVFSVQFPKFLERVIKRESP